MVVWQMKPGMARDFEEGYKRHLDWHRKNNDTWTWRGWTIVSGEHFGYFVDGTFFHTWKELDTPVSPAADSADNGVNVMPYAEIRSAAFYEAVTCADKSFFPAIGCALAHLLLPRCTAEQRGRI